MKKRIEHQAHYHKTQWSALGNMFSALDNTFSALDNLHWVFNNKYFKSLYEGVDQNSDTFVSLLQDTMVGTG